LDNKHTNHAIHVISRGKTLVGNTLPSKKAYVKQAYQVNFVMKILENEKPITFTPKDRGDITMPHKNLMVIFYMMAKHPIE